MYSAPLLIKAQRQGSRDLVLPIDTVHSQRTYSLGLYLIALCGFIRIKDHDMVQFCCKLKPNVAFGEELCYLSKLVVKYAHLRAISDVLLQSGTLPCRPRARAHVVLGKSSLLALFRLYRYST